MDELRCDETTLGAVLVWRLAHTTQVSADLEVPMWIVYLAVKVGFVLVFV